MNTKETPAGLKQLVESTYATLRTRYPREEAAELAVVIVQEASKVFAGHSPPPTEQAPPDRTALEPA